MGYSLSIGEAKLEFYEDDTHPSLHIGVKGEYHKKAPAYDEPTDHENQRWPSYTSWHDFSKDAGIHEMMFGEGTYKEWVKGYPLIAHHPGETVLTEAHREEVNRAYELRKQNGKIPGYPYEDYYGNKLKPDHEKYDPTLARLTWLHYWVNWALDNCKIPVFVNT